MELNNKTAVITGGGTGVGRVTAIFLAKKGCNLALLGRRLDKLQKTAGELRALGIDGVRVEVYLCDVTKDAEVRAVFAKIGIDFGQIDFLVNNAGVNTYTTLEQIGDEQIDAEIDIKSKGIIYCTRAALPFMKSGSAVVNLTSVNAFLGGKSSPAYPASNGAANTLTKYFAVKLADKGIRVNAVAPGFIEGTGFTEKIPAEKLAAIAAQNPMKRNAQAEDVAKAIYFLLSDLSGYVNGHTVHVNGGYYMN
ncbi:MAG: SDR family oxidoreductase [Patescibacteria group bacterium]